MGQGASEEIYSAQHERVTKWTHQNGRRERIVFETTNNEEYPSRPFPSISDIHSESCVNIDPEVHHPAYLTLSTLTSTQMCP